MELLTGKTQRWFLLVLGSTVGLLVVIISRGDMLLSGYVPSLCMTMNITDDSYRIMEDTLEELQKEDDEIHRLMEEMTSTFEEGVKEGKEGYMKSAFEADILLLRSILKKYKKSLDDEWEAMVSVQEKRGILMVAGEPRYMLNAFVSLWPVRHYWKSTLPISIFFWGKTENVSFQTKDFFQTHIGGDISCVDLSHLVDVAWPAHHRDLFPRNQKSGRLGWVLKLIAVYFAPYQEILYLDADSSPLADPTTMFTLQDYKKTGALFWPDTPCSRPGIFQQLIEMNLIDERDAPRVDEHQSESGQWLLNRRMHREPIEYTMAMGSHSDFTFSYAFGDKDLFRAGFALAGDADKYSLIPTTLGFAWSAPAGDSQGDGINQGERTMRGYIQFSSNGEPLFHHRAGWKTKYEFNEHEERDLESISSPLSCEWLRHYWPMEYPGVISPDRLHPIQKRSCTYSLASFETAVTTCASNFTGTHQERVPLFSIKGSHIEHVVQKAMHTAWKTALDARQKSNNAIFSTIQQS